MMIRPCCDMIRKLAERNEGTHDISHSARCVVDCQKLRSQGCGLLQQSADRPYTEATIRANVSNCVKNRSLSVS
jgi:hypothetical protein